jgi:hypothetical protein
MFRPRTSEPPQPPGSLTNTSQPLPPYSHGPTQESCHRGAYWVAAD